MSLLNQVEVDAILSRTKVVIKENSDLQYFRPKILALIKCICQEVGFKRATDDTSNQFFNTVAYYGVRNMGSCSTPFALYLPEIFKGYTPLKVSDKFKQKIARNIKATAFNYTEDLNLWYQILGNLPQEGV